MARSMEIATPLGDDVLLFHRLHAREELSRSSEFHLDLLCDPRTVIDFDEILGKNVTVKIVLQDESLRYFNGFVTRFAAAGRHGGYLRFTATVSPWAWFLTRTSDCRIFQEMTVREILETVFADHPVANFKFELSESYEKLSYCVQYRETDFNFISRLMEHEGIYYYYRHIDGGHTMVLTDSIDRHEPFPGYEIIRFIRPQELVRPDLEHINSWEFSREVQPGVFALDDYDFERPAVDLLLQRQTPRTYTPSDYEWFEYPGYFTKKPRGEQLAQVRGDEFGSRFERGVAVTNARGVCVGSIFTLDGFSREDQNGKHLVVSSIQDFEYSDYEAMPEQGGSAFSCRFVAMPTAQAFRPQRITPKPFVQGPQTAVVVGPSGEEIYADEYGRVKVKFHWDRYSRADADSSCWIRVSQNWAGKRWGAMFLPRIGQEVIVDFLEGDPDQPIIVGRVYNADLKPPYELPRESTKSTIKSYSSKGGGGFNEIRFEDKKGSEQVFVHAEKDQDNRVKNDSKEWIGNERHLIVKNDQMEQVDGDKHLTVKGDQNEKVDGTVSLKAGMDLQQKVGMKHALDAGMEIHLKAGTTIVLEAGASLTLKVGGNFINLNPGGVFIKGTLVMINSGGSAGSGSGSSPAAPKAAKEADKAEPGEATAPPRASPITPARAPNIQATVLRQAAATGVPFCEKCEEARQAQEAAQA